ncbi:helicase [Candidatus Poribacteria bacterium]|nr:helicase [Candidatus Poribacteria bacterium]MYH81969.1 helicase [Candidatus Poribacteria bacterium]MYK96583.1 helicase [Candidatus Poribacteria bacterium]
MKKADNTDSQTQIFYACVDEFWRKEDKYDHLNSKQHYRNVEWKRVTPDKRNTWLTEGLHAEFDSFIPMGNKAMKAAKGVATDVIFKTYSLGVSTNRDVWVYNFNQDVLSENVHRMIENYNAEVDRWQRQDNPGINIDDFVMSDSEKIKWSSGLKQKLMSGQAAEFSNVKVRQSLYRPFTKSNLFFDRIMNQAVSLFPLIFPIPETETENRVIIVSDHGFRSEFSTLMANLIPDLHTLSTSDGFQCFPFYIYDEDGTNRRENITDWALAQFRTHYEDDTITKWDIFHYNYGLLHHPDYREKYEANLKRDLPHIPFATDFRGFAEAGARLANLHVTYESQPEYAKLKFVQTPDTPLDWCVEKMKLSKDKTSLIYNNFLTLSGIPPKVFDYRLGTRSALEWVVDQYRVKIDKRSGIVNDPNRADDPQYIVKLIAKVITVSLETVDIINQLPTLK